MSFIGFIKSLFDSNSSTTDPSYSRPDLDLLIKEIRNSGGPDSWEPGYRIHHFDYRSFTVRLDLDVTETYRITLNHGKERVYGFSVHCDLDNYEDLREAFARILAFIEGDGKPKDLPDDEQIKGHFFGW